MESVFPFLCQHVRLSGQSVPPFIPSRQQRPSFPRRLHVGPRSLRSVGAGLTTRSSEQRLAVGSVPSIMSSFASLCR